MGFFAMDFIGVQAFLERHSRPQPGDQNFPVNFDQFCAVYRFTYRDFANGVLGLAYVAQPGTTGGGGICSSTLNTGIVTLLNFGRRVPENINQLTFAHELGHNFGSGVSGHTHVRTYVHTCVHSRSVIHCYSLRRYGHSCISNRCTYVCMYCTYVRTYCLL